MLNHVKVLQELQAMVDRLVVDLTDEFECAHMAWKALSKDPLFKEKVAKASCPWLIPRWSDDLANVYGASKAPEQYAVIGIDGSQIYPDRHQGTQAYLVNIGMVVLRYGIETKAVEFATQPSVYVPDQDPDFSQGNDLVNCRRQELEFSCALALMRKEALHTYQAPRLLLFDGSLIFWHLEGKEQEVKEYFVSRYLHDLYQLYKERLLIVGYISSPKSKELINLVRLYLADFDPEHNHAYKAIDHMVDAHLAQGILQPGERTILLASQSPIVDLYPSPLKPYFFYLNVGSEIARIELPQWIAEDMALVDQVTALIMDQVGKGFGYPVACAEAHEQAVVKGPDRDFFYHLIQKLTLESKQKLNSSLKSLKKRGMGI